MRRTQAQIDRAAAELGFEPVTLEKALHLMELLDGLRSHPYLGRRVVLKGGAAINLFVLPMPRLSVDVDFNYVGELELEAMLADRPRVEQAVRSVCGRLGLEVKRVPGDHAGGKWRMKYRSASGGPQTLELDLNFLLRSPLWDPETRTSASLGDEVAHRVPMVEVHELAAGKLCALFARKATRDPFDVRGLLERGDLDEARLRTAFVVYGAMSRRDWRTLAVDDVRMDPREAQQELLPLLRADEAPAPQAIAAWCDQLVADCRRLLACVLPLASHELEFLDSILERGDILPELLTSDGGLQARIREHPALRWKALNVRKGFGGATRDDLEGREAPGPEH